MRSFDWTPISFCSGTYFDGIASKSIEVAAIETINFLDDIEVIKKSTLIEKIVPSFYGRYMIERETYPLVDRNNTIKKECEWKNSVDKRNGKEMPNIGRDNILPGREFESSVSLSKFIKKYDLSFSKFKPIFFCQSIILSPEFHIEFIDFFENFLDSRVHTLKIKNIRENPGICEPIHPHQQQPSHVEGLDHR